MNTIDLTPIIQAAILLIAAIITNRLIPWIKAKTTEKQFELMQTVAYTAVIAAEQIFGSGHGKEKLEYALQYCEDHLSNAGLTIDRGTIEETVRKLQGPYGPLGKVEPPEDEVLSD